MRDDAVTDDAAVVARLRSAGCVFAEDEAAMLLSAARSRDELDALVERRAAGEPLEQVVGWAEFAGLRIVVDPGVFVPRRRSEFLVSVAVGLAGWRAGRRRDPGDRRSVLRHRRPRARGRERAGGLGRAARGRP